VLAQPRRPRVPGTDRSRGGAVAGRPGLAVRKGAELALVTVARGVAIAALAAASRDPHLGVRKAAVSSLSGWAGH